MAGPDGEPLTGPVPAEVQAEAERWLYHWRDPEFEPVPWCGQPGGFGSRWNLQLPPGNDPCQSAKTLDRGDGQGGVGTFHGPRPRPAGEPYFQPPRLVEVTWTGTGSLSVFVVNNGAVLGPRKHPGPNAFAAGATPESRGAPVACTMP